MNDIPKFLVIRFAAGAGANFLTSILQCSPEVGHWQQNLEDNKSSQDWLSYFKTVFVPNLDEWLEHEPVSKQRLGTREIFSATYDRGNNLTLTEFFESEKKFCTEFYFKLKDKGVFIPTHWHKSHVPEYFKNATFIDILLDQDSLNWFDISVLKKNFSIIEVREDKSIVVRNNEHRPSITPTTFNGHNDYHKTYPSYDVFYQSEILENKWRSQYLCKQPNPHDRPQFELYLSDLLDYKKFNTMYKRMCEHLSLTRINDDTLCELHSYWRNLHEY